MKISRVNNTLLNSLYKNAGSTFSIKSSNTRTNNMKSDTFNKTIKINKYPNYNNSTYIKENHYISTKVKSPLNVGLNLDKSV